jgi:hypothetical protein
VGHVGVTDQCSFPIVGRVERARVGSVPRPQVQGEPWHTTSDWPSSQGTNWPQTMSGRPGELADRMAIFADGAPAPLVSSFEASKSFCRSVDAINAHDVTLAGDASFNGGIFLAVIAVDRALKGSMTEERMNKSFGREVREKVFKGREPLFSS